MPRWSPFEPYFWSLVKKNRNSCWIWNGDKSKGYGRIWRGKRRYAAHRVAYELCIGPIPEGLYICHHCDNRLCVNPKHLFVGTQKDNMQDWTRKGKNKLINTASWRRGKRHWTKTHPKSYKKWQKYVSSLRKHEWATGKRIAIRDKKGRINGTRVLSC